MKAIILCAGYATRLYPFTINEPKSLLYVDGKPLLSYTIKQLHDIKAIDRIFIVTNNKFYNRFLEWEEKQGKETNKVEIINDKTARNEERLGGVVDLGLALEKAGEDDILVILGDNYFGFNLKKFVDFFNRKQRICIALHDIQDKEKSKKYGVAEISKGKVLRLKEKPLNPFSTLITTGCYIFPESDLGGVRDYIQSGKNKEGPTYIMEDFIEQGKEIYGFVFDEPWYDIGTIEDYEKIKKEIAQGKLKNDIRN